MVEPYIFLLFCPLLLLFNGCAKLLDIGRNWNTLLYTFRIIVINRASQTCSMDDMSGEMLAMQELGCFQLPGIVCRSLQHRVVHYHAATWGDGRGWMNQQWDSGSHPVTLCMQNAINEMHLCLLSITCTCPYHNPTATMGHSIYNVDISKQLTHMTPHTLSAIYPNRKKPLQCARCHRMWEFAHSSQLQWLTAVRSRPRQSVQKFFGYAKWLLQQLSGQLVSDDLGSEHVGCGGPGWCGYTWSADMSPVGCTAKLSETPLETTYGRAVNIQFTGNSSGSSSQHANRIFPQNFRHL